MNKINSSTTLQTYAIVSILQFWNKQKGLTRWLSCSEKVLLFQMAQDCSQPTLGNLLTAACSTSSRGCNALIWPLGTCGHTLRRSTRTDTLIKNKIFLNIISEGWKIFSSIRNNFLPVLKNAVWKRRTSGHMPSVTALRRRQADLCEHKRSLDYIVSSSTARAMSRDPVSKANKILFVSKLNPLFCLAWWHTPVIPPPGRLK